MVEASQNYLVAEGKGAKRRASPSFHSKLRSPLGARPYLSCFDCLSAWVLIERKIKWKQPSLFGGTESLVFSQPKWIWYDTEGEDGCPEKYSVFP